MKSRIKLGKRILSLLLAVVMALGIVPFGNLVKKAYAETAEKSIKIAVLSDTHYYPVSYVSDCEDYTTYVNGDPKMLEESGGILDSALQMVIKDRPDVLLVSGDLTKDGEVKGHEEFAEKLEMIKNHCPDTQIYVTNGNHDINNTDAWTFASGEKVPVESASPDKFSEIYSGFGYNSGRTDTDQIQYYINSAEHPEGRVVGGLSYTADLGNSYRLLVLDSGMYSVDSGNGYDHDEHITAGKIDSFLLDWAVRVIKEARENGETVIGMMHHGLIPHFDGEEDLLHEYVVTNWEETAEALADAGLRYVFTGHMHANDIAEYTTVRGNHISDVETGSLVSYGSPVRSVVLKKNTLSGAETFDVSSRSVQAVSYVNARGEAVQIDDMTAYSMEKLYPERLLNNMLNGIATPFLKEMAASGDLKAYLGEVLKTDLDKTVLEAAKNAVLAGMNLNLGEIGTAVVSGGTDGIHIKVSGVGGIVVPEEVITDDELLAVFENLLSQIQSKYVEDPSYIKTLLDELATEVSTFGLGVQKEDGSEASLYDLIVFILTNHYGGRESAPDWVKKSIEVLKQGEIIKGLLDTLVPSLYNKLVPILENIHVDFNLALSGSLIKTTLNSKYEDGQIKALLDGFGVDIQEIINNLISEYMSESFKSGMGELVAEIVEGMVYDGSADDVLGGDHRILTYSGVMDANPQEASVENGLLPSEISMTFGAEESTSKAFQWYTGPSVTDTRIRYSTSADLSDSITANGESEEVKRPKTLMNLGLISTYTTQLQRKHTVAIENLTPETTYYYQVGTDGKWSETASFTTASSNDRKFTAIAVADSQGMVKSDYQVFEETFAKAQSVFSDSEFTMHLGDMVDEGVNVKYWDYLTNNRTWRSQTIVPVSGNHEAKKAVEGVTGDTVSNQFNLNGILEKTADNSGVYYSFTYKNATFVVLNTNDGEAGISDTQYSWAENILKTSESTWKIILMHKAVYSNGPHYDDSDVKALRSKVDKLCAETGVDLVLSGHDHVYNRTPILKKGAVSEADEVKTVKYDGFKYTQSVNADGTVFAVVGTSGVKNYVQDTGCGIPSEVALQPDCPIFSGLTIEENALYFRAYTYDTETGSASLADSFSLSKIDTEEEAYLKVVEMIDKLPLHITLEDKKEVEAARNAYELLEETAKNQVNNYQKLVEAEASVKALEAIGSGREVTVTTKAELEAALNDSTVTSVKVSGTIDCKEKEYVIKRNIRIGGTGELKYGWFRVTEGAVLILADSIYVNGSRAWGSFYASITPVTVEDNSSVRLENSAHVRTEYGARGNGYGIYLKGANSSAVIDSSAQQWASDGVIYGENAASSITINNGSFESKNWDSAVSGRGTVTVNGGNKIAGLEVAAGAVGYINGGTFTEGTSSTQYTPLVIKGTAYMTAGTVMISEETGKAAEVGGTLHIRPSGSGAVKLGNHVPYIGSIQTTNFKEVSAEIGSLSGIRADASGDKLVASAIYTTDFVKQAGLPVQELTTSVTGNILGAAAPSGTSYLFARSGYYGSGRSVDNITGNGTIYLYNHMRSIENYRVTGIEIESGSPYVILQPGKDTVLTAAVKPDNALNDSVYWTSQNEAQTHVVDASKGIVNSAKPGVTTITAASSEYPDVTDTIEAITMEVSEFKGPADVITGSEGNLYTMSLGDGLEGTGLHVVYSVDDSTRASIDPATGEMKAAGAGNVTVTATAYYKEEALPVSKSLSVRISDLDLKLYAQPLEGGSVRKDKETYHYGDVAQIEAAARDGYRFAGWKDADGDLVSTDASCKTAALKADTSYTAVFEKLYEIKLPEGLSGGSITSEVSQAAEGDRVALTVSADTGWQAVPDRLKVIYRTVDENGKEITVPVEMAEDQTFVMPGADVEILAEFEKTPYNLTVDPGIKNGTVTVSGQSASDGSAVMGDVIEVTVVPEEGYLLKENSLKWNDTVLTAGEDGGYRFEMPAGCVRITAEFIVNEAYKNLKEEIEKAEAIDVSGMTAESTAKLQEEIEAAKKALTSDITDEVSEDHIARLENAIAGLKKLQNANLRIVATRGGSVRYDGMLQYDYAGYVEPGTTVSLTAEAEEGAEFLYWQDMISHKIITEETVYTFIMGSGIDVKAVFSKPVENQYQVTFLSEEGIVLKTGSVKAGGSVTPPAVPVKSGYKFAGWDTEAYRNVTCDLTVTAIMERDGTWYTVSAVNGTVNGEQTLQKEYDTTVTAKAGQAPEGKTFAYWKLAGTDTIVSYEEEFSFRVFADAALEAVFADDGEKTEKAPVVWLYSNYEMNGRKVSMFLQRELPEGCEIVEWGVLLMKSHVDELEYGMEGVRAVQITPVTDIRQIETLNFTGSGVINATFRGYMVYKDADGNLKYAYSGNLLHVTVQ